MPILHPCKLALTPTREYQVLLQAAVDIIPLVLLYFAIASTKANFCMQLAHNIITHVTSLRQPISLPRDHLTISLPPALTTQTSRRHIHLQTVSRNLHLFACALVFHFITSQHHTSCPPSHCQTFGFITALFSHEATPNLSSSHPPSSGR
jgi:hypothetical protein